MNGKMKISKEFDWEMAHRLLDHESGCRNMHGHSYRMQLEIEGEPNEVGMIIDFDHVGKILRPLITELDHSFLCDERDAVLIAFLKDQQMKHKVVPFRTTVENLCTYFADHLKAALVSLPNIQGFSLRIYETARNSAVLDVSLRS
jgi:6-pyruvoyltetrahydropterin/6-carboxytetrahydropterin synthase